MSYEDPTFRFLTEEEFFALTLEERTAYILRAQKRLEEERNLLRGYVKKQQQGKGED